MNASHLLVVLLHVALLSPRWLMADGTVNLSNLIPGSGPVTNSLTGALATTSDGLLVGLYYAPAGEMDELLYTYLPAPTTFLQGVQSGYFAATPGRFIPGSTSTVPIMVQIRVWETNYGATYEAALAAPVQNGRKALVGKSNKFQVSVAQPAATPAKLVGLNGFSVSPIPSGPTLLIDDITVAEGSNGTVNASFTVLLASPQPQTVTVNFTTQDGTALAGLDYLATNGVATFLPGETNQFIRVVLTGDGPPEGDEVFSVMLSNPVNATITKAAGTCLITEARLEQIRVDTVLSFHTVAGRRYAVEATTDFQNWLAVTGASYLLATTNTMTISDAGVACQGGRYYRIRLIP